MPTKNYIKKGLIFILVNVFLVLTLLILINASLGENDNNKESSTVTINEKMLEIECGWFKLGTKDGKGSLDEDPEHMVFVDMFYIDETEVTNEAYKEFCDLYNHTYPVAPVDMPDYFEKYTNYPVVNVSWSDASAYCDAKNKRLPTEAEWFYAASGGLDDMNYSITEKWDSKMYNSIEWNTQHSAEDPRVNLDKEGGPMPVKSFVPNKHHLFDMTGNVSEWVIDWYDNKYYLYSNDSNPTGPKKGNYKVVKGGSFLDDKNTSRLNYRSYAHPFGRHYVNVGFRCMADKENVLWDEATKSFRTNPKTPLPQFKFKKSTHKSDGTITDMDEGIPKLEKNTPKIDEGFSKLKKNTPKIDEDTNVK